MSGTMLCQAQVNLVKYLPETAKILHHDIFWFFMRDEDFVSRTFNEGSVDLDKFPASKVYQLVKKMKSLKATARHIRQVAGDPQTAQINLMCHQHADLPSEKNKKRKPVVKQRNPHHKNAEHPLSGQFKRNITPNVHTSTKIDAPSVVTLLIQRDSNAQPRNSSARLATSLATSQASATKEINENKLPISLGNLRPIN